MTVAADGTIGINDGTNAGTTTNIGKAGNTVNLLGTSNLTGTANINAGTGTSATNIGTGTTAGTVTIGRTGGNNNYGWYDRSHRCDEHDGQPWTNRRPNGYRKHQSLGHHARAADEWFSWY